jgi:uncharacterized protein (DUF433 family)
MRLEHSIGRVTFTAVEASVLCGVDEKFVRNILQEELPDCERRGLRIAQLAYLRACKQEKWKTLFQKETREVLYGELLSALSSPSIPEEIEIAHVRVSLKELLGWITMEVQPFVAWKEKRVESDPEVLAGAPIFKDSRLSVRRIGLLAQRGESTTDILRDYPYLTSEDVKYAALFVRAYPSIGRPRASSSKISLR